MRGGAGSETPKTWKASLVCKTPSTLRTWVSSAGTSLIRLRKKEAGSRMTSSRAENSKAGVLEEEQTDPASKPGHRVR